MNDQSDQIAIALDRWPHRATLAVVSAVGILCALASIPCLVALSRFNIAADEQPYRTGIAFLLWLGLVVAIAGVVVVSSRMPLGRWKLDSEGTIEESLRGRKRQIPWTAVSTVRMHGGVLTICGESESIALPWIWLSTQQQLQVASLLRSQGFKVV
jgi:hypothetical protein